MTRRAFILQLRPDSVNEYERRHQVLPADLEAATRASGIRNYTIFMHGSVAFGYFESDHIDAVLAAGANDPVVERWQEEIGRLRADGATDVPFLKEVFHLD